MVVHATQFYSQSCFDMKETRFKIIDVPSPGNRARLVRFELLRAFFFKLIVQRSLPTCTVKSTDYSQYFYAVVTMAALLNAVSSSLSCPFA